MKLWIFTLIVITVASWSVLYDLDALFYATIFLNAFVNIYLLLNGSMIPNAKGLIYDFFITNYDKNKKKEYMEKMRPFSSLFEDEYPSPLIFMAWFLIALACQICGRPDLTILYMASLILVQFVHIVMSYRSVMRDG
jgi:hypothetical protein